MLTPYSTHVYDEVTSTQDVARALAGHEPVLVVAARQTAGRGRSGSTWETAPRAVAASLVLRPGALGWPVERWSLLPLAVGVAVARLHDLDLKWPNDLLRDGKKVGGILVETSGPTATIGTGLNLWWPKAPEDRTALWAHDPGSEAYEEVGSEIGAAVWQELALGPDGFGWADYLARCTTLGQDITWGEQGNYGRAAAIDPHTGALLVDSAGGQARLLAGEIHHVRTR